MKCIHADGLAGASDWFDQMSGRIDRATADNGIERAICSTPADEPVQGRMEVDSLERPDESAGPDEEDAPLDLRGLGFLLLGIGALATLYGWALGTLLAAGGYFALVRPRLVLRARTDVALAVAFVGCLAIGNVEARARKRSLAEWQFARLSAEIAARRRLTGELPSELGELGWRLYPIFEGGRPVDPWGRPWRYRSHAATGSDGRSFDLGSTGPDGVPSGDDVGRVPR